MKSVSILIFLFLILYIIYNFSYSYFYKKKEKKKIEYILMPNSVHDYFKIQNLEEKYRDMFHNIPISSDYTIDLY
jgi:hypothetical protein